MQLLAQRPPKSNTRSPLVFLTTFSSLAAAIPFRELLAPGDAGTDPDAEHMHYLMTKGDQYAASALQTAWSKNLCSRRKGKGEVETMKQ